MGVLLEADRHGFNSAPPLCRGDILAGHFTYMSEPQFPPMASGIRTPTPEALRGMQRDLIPQVQSLLGGGWGEVLAVASSEWWKQPQQRGWFSGTWYLNSAGLFQSPGLLSTSLSLQWLRKSAAHGLLVGTQRNKHRGHWEGMGTFPCQRGCGQLAHSRDRRCWWCD